MDPLIRRRIYNLLCIKSIVTLALTGLFVFLAVTGQVSTRDFITIFSIVIAFYFGTQSQNPGDDVLPAVTTRSASRPAFPGREHFSAFSSFFLTENRV